MGLLAYSLQSVDLGETVGILGISFDDEVATNVGQAIKQAWGNDTTLGNTPLSNIFSQNSSLITAFDISLGRQGDIDEYAEGAFIIGKHAAQYASVQQAPKLPQVTEERWSVLIDGLSLNGKNYTFVNNSEVSSVPAGKLVGFLDTGTSLPQVPNDVADFIYDNIPGSVKANGTWFVPCHGGANLTWYLGYAPRLLSALCH